MNDNSDDKRLQGRIEDKIHLAETGYMVTATGFLTPHERSLAEAICKKPGSAEIRKVFSGGYEDAERRVLLCLPDYADISEVEKEMLTVIDASTKPGGRELKHSDYLGSLIGLGLERSVIGDILVRPHGADIIVLKEIAEFILINYAKAGRSELSLTEKPIDQLVVPEGAFEEQSDTVASLRLDSIIASAFGVSRTKAQEAIRRGMVFQNSKEVLKPDAIVQEGDRLVLRGKGKVILEEIGGVSRKGRQYISFKRYK